MWDPQDEMFFDGDPARPNRFEHYNPLWFAPLPFEVDHFELDNLEFRGHSIQVRYNASMAVNSPSAETTAGAGHCERRDIDLGESGREHLLRCE